MMFYRFRRQFVKITHLDRELMTARWSFVTMVIFIHQTKHLI